LHGLNVEGLRRRGFNPEQIDSLRKAYRVLFRSKLLLKDALEKVRREVVETPEVSALVQFVANSQRGVCR
jgi:UDP-N-acetylglucosamine acyltransferase